MLVLYILNSFMRILIHIYYALLVCFYFAGYDINYICPGVYQIIQVSTNILDV